MDSTSNPEALTNLLAWVRKWQAWVPVYAIVIGLICQQGYWGLFDVHFLEYIGWQDVIRLSIPGIVSVLLSLVMLIIEIQYLEARQELRSRHARSDVSKIRRRIARVLAFSVLFVGLVLVGLWNFPRRAVIFFGIGTLVVLAMFFAFRRQFACRDPSTRLVRDASLLGLIVAPMLAYTYGVNRGLSVLRGVEYTSVITPVADPTWFAKLSATSEVRLIGHLNEYDFFLINGRTFVVRAETMPALALERAGAGFQFRIPFIDEPAFTK